METRGPAERGAVPGAQTSTLGGRGQAEGRLLGLCLRPTPASARLAGPHSCADLWWPGRPVSLQLPEGGGCRWTWLAAVDGPVHVHVPTWAEPSFLRAGPVPGVSLPWPRVRWAQDAALADSPRGLGFCQGQHCERAWGLRPRCLSPRTPARSPPKPTAPQPPGALFGKGVYAEATA